MKNPDENKDLMDLLAEFQEAAEELVFNKMASMVVEKLREAVSAVCEKGSVFEGREKIIYLKVIERIEKEIAKISGDIEVKNG